MIPAQVILGNLQSGYVYEKESASTGVKKYIIAFSPYDGKYWMSVDYERHNPSPDNVPWQLTEEEVLYRVQDTPGWHLRKIWRGEEP